MKQRVSVVLALWVLTLSLVTSVVFALSEAEPNNTMADANALEPRQPMSGAIDPESDLDYFAIDGINPTWGFIALLDTSGSTDSKEATLTVLGNDGTPLQEDTGSWEKGSGIALQPFSDGDATHYLRAEEEGNNATVTTYTLRYFETIVSTQPESEPNETPETGTPSSFTHAATFDGNDDVDCYTFHGRGGDTVLIAVNSDPENDHSTTNPVLRLYDPSNVELDSVDIAGRVGGNEFLEYGPLAEEGAYAYCVETSPVGGGGHNTYHVGIVRNARLYLPSYEHGVTWLNPGLDGIAMTGETLTFELVFRNTSPVTIPGDIDMLASYSPTCLEYVSAKPSPSSSNAGSIQWMGVQNGLAPGETFTATVTMEALANCDDVLHQDVLIRYYSTGVGADAPYIIRSNWLYLPMLTRH